MSSRRLERYGYDRYDAWCLNSSFLSISDMVIKGKCECVPFNLACEIEFVDVSLDYIVKAM